MRSASCSIRALEGTGLRRVARSRRRGPEGGARQAERCQSLLENTAGAGGTTGRDFDELARILELGSGTATRALPRLLSPAGVRLRGAPSRCAGGRRRRLDSKIGLDRLTALHINAPRCHSGRTATVTRRSATASSASAASGCSSRSPGSRGCPRCSRPGPDAEDRTWGRSGCGLRREGLANRRRSR